MSDKKDLIWRAYLVYLGFFIAMIVVIVKVVLIQTEGSASFFASTEEKIPTRSADRFPRRGEVLDRNYTPLITSVSSYDIHMDPTVVSDEVFDRDISKLAEGLSKLFPETSARGYEEYIRKGRANGNRYLKIKLKVTNEQRRRLRELPIFELPRHKGGLIDNEEIVMRKRPHGEMLKRTLGYYQAPVVEKGKVKVKELRVGIEGAYNEILAGEPGKEIEQKISSGWKKTGQVIRQPIEGADLITSFDLGIQEVAHSELYKQLKNQSAKSGCVIVMDVKTGFVRAMVNLHVGSDGEYYEKFNQAIGTPEVPGSTFKLATLMAALEDDKVKLTDTVNATGKYTFFGETFEDSYEYGYGRISVRRAFEVSSNVFTKIIYNAYKGEPEAFIERLKAFGLDKPLGISLEGERDPVMHTPGTRYWSGLSIPSMAIGYEYQQTPLQTLAFYNSVANNGTMVRPQFVEQIRRGSQVVKTFRPVVLKKQICSEKTLRQLQLCLEGVVEQGTGSALKSSLFQIAGKTGTARILNDDNSYGEKGSYRYQASFVGYFPAKDPIYSCIVVVSAPSKDIYGATVSGTVFTAIANKVYSNTLKYHKAINEEKQRVKQAPVSMDGNGGDLIRVLTTLGVKYNFPARTDWAFTKANGTVVEMEPRKMQKGVVPNVIGLSARDAVYLMEKAGLTSYLRGAGKVVKQTIPAGTSSDRVRGGLVELILE